MTVKLRMAGVTHLGRVRACNEDAIAWDEASGVTLVADGMGGHNAGDVASDLAVDVITCYLRDHAQELATESPAAQIDKAKVLLSRSIAEANQSIHERASNDPECADMGTTVVAALFLAQGLVVAHVGDSRLYRLRRGKLLALTRDHSLVNKMLDEGAVSPNDPLVDRYRNVLTRALGHRSSVICDTAGHDIDHGDIYLACSDGLYTMVDEAQIREILMSHASDPSGAVTQLVELANRQGGADNISAIVVTVE